MAETQDKSMPSQSSNGENSNSDAGNSSKLTSDEDVDEYFKRVMPVIAAAVKASNLLPSGEQYEYYTTYKEFLDLMQVESNQALQVLSKLLKQNGIRSGILGSVSSEADADDRLESLIDANDQLTERISTRLDEASGLRKAPKVELMVATTPNSNTKESTTPTTSASWNVKQQGEKKTPASYRLLAARFVQRPQTKFKEKVDNSDSPFYPKLSGKPNSIIDLKESLLVRPTEDGAVPPVPNPYKYEIEAFDYTEDQLKAAKQPQMPKPLSESGPYTYIDTPEALDKLCDELINVTELAVDLELSTRSHDYIVDTLALRSDLQKLNIIFTNPQIVKVFHGADSDIEWLQRDFNVYVVNMFDTYQASKVLSFSRHSLAFLLKHYCQVEADKQYQLADWRIRPLPTELVDYAREDTHYLLYIYDMMKNVLIQKGNNQKNLLKSVLDQSKAVCLKVYKKPSLADGGFHILYSRSRKSFNSKQLYALEKLFEWRFRLAQQEDESTGYILPNHILLQISEVLPRESSGVLACCTPIPPLVRQHLHVIHSIVKEARNQPLTTSRAIRIEARQQATLTKSLLDRPHDLPLHNQPTSSNEVTTNIKLGKLVEKTTSMLSFVSTTLTNSISQTVKEIRDAFESPLKSYNPVKFIDYAALYSEQTQKRKADISLNDSSLDTSTEQTPAKSARHSIHQMEVQRMPDSEEAEVGEGAGTMEEGEVAEGQMEEEETEMSKAVKKQLKKMREKLPLRLRPASNPQKKLVTPAENFQPYDYSQADYSEFKPPKAPKPKREKFNKNKFKSNSNRPDEGRSFTYRK